MPASAKNVDWPRVLRRVATGESPSALARELPVTRQAIENRYKRHMAKKRSADTSGDKQQEQATDATLHVAWLPIVRQTFKAPAGSKDSPERRAEILQAISEGTPKNAAARSAGISEDTLARWAEADEVFAGQITQAQSSWQAEVAKDWKTWTGKDWRAAQAYLQSHPDSRHEWGQNSNGQGTGGINIILNVPPPQPIDENTVIIDAGIPEDYGRR